LTSLLINGSIYIIMYSCTLVLDPLGTVSHCDVLCHRRDTSAKWDEGHYVPNRPVVKESGTTRVRPVFDASAREHGQPSLNQCLEKGVSLIGIIPTIILSVRINQIGIIADIRKAFLQISLCEGDRNFLRFFMG